MSCCGVPSPYQVPLHWLIGRLIGCSASAPIFRLSGVCAVDGKEKNSATIERCRRPFLTKKDHCSLLTVSKVCRGDLAVSLFCAASKHPTGPGPVTAKLCQSSPREEGALWSMFRTATAPLVPSMVFFAYGSAGYLVGAVLFLPCHWGHGKRAHSRAVLLRAGRFEPPTSTPPFCHGGRPGSGGTWRCGAWPEWRTCSYPQPGGECACLPDELWSRAAPGVHQLDGLDNKPQR